MSVLISSKLHTMPQSHSMFLLDMRVEGPPGGEDGLAVPTLVGEAMRKVLGLQMPADTDGAPVAELVTQATAVMIILPGGNKLVQLFITLN